MPFKNNKDLVGFCDILLVLLISTCKCQTLIFYAWNTYTSMPSNFTGEQSASGFGCNGRHTKRDYVLPTT